MLLYYFTLFKNDITLEYYSIYKGIIKVSQFKHEIFITIFLNLIFCIHASTRLSTYLTAIHLLLDLSIDLLTYRSTA